MTRFDAARRAGLMRDLLAHLLGRPADLLPFDKVKERLHLKKIVDRGIQEVPLERIVGTVAREREFTREFLPREESLRGRWEDVEGLADGSEGFPPVELYRVGNADFVVDGHHRISVARAVGANSIEARVKEFVTPVPLAPESSIEDVILKEGLADFLETTGLVPEHPDEFRVTEPNGYERLLDHIAVHRYFLGRQWQRSFPWEEAVRSWRDTVYRPMVRTIRQSGILEDFRGRTETDLYLFTMDHLHHLRQRYGPSLPLERAVRHFRRSLRLGAWGRLRARVRRLWRRPPRGQEPGSGLR